MVVSTLLTVQQYLPLASVVVWWGLAAFQVARDRYRTWTEAFFLLGCIFVGFYALCDVFFFTASTQDTAASAALAGFSALMLSTTFFMLFGLVFYTKIRRLYFLAFVPAALILPGTWAYLIPNASTDIVPLNTVSGGPPWVGEWDKTWFAIWVAVSVGYAIVAAIALFLTYREVSSQTTKLRRRMLGLFLATLLTVVLGTLTNVIRGFSHAQVLPLFSAALVVPGAVSFLTLSPLSTERFSVAVRRWKASRYQIMAAFMIFADGTLIGAKIRPGEKVIDQDLFGATLDVIQNFMRTSFPTLRGSLSAVKQGDYTLVMERGKFAYLTVILQGEENDQLRRHMRDLLLHYEHDNQPVLSDWRGMPSEAIGTDAMLADLLEGT